LHKNPPFTGIKADHGSLSLFFPFLSSHGTRNHRMLHLLRK